MKSSLNLFMLNIACRNYCSFQQSSFLFRNKGKKYLLILCIDLLKFWKIIIADDFDLFSYGNFDVSLLSV